MANEYLAARMETVRPVLNEMYEADASGTLYGQLSDKVDETKIVKTPNSTDFRIPLEVKPPGQIAAMNLASGTFKSGTPGLVQQMNQSYFTMQAAFRINLEEVFNSADTEKSTINAFDRIMTQAPKRLAMANDVSFHSLGAGNQGLIALGTAYDTGVFTFDTEHGANLLWDGQEVEIFSNDLLTHRTSAVPTNLPYLTAVNKQLGTATVTNLGAITPQATDYLAFPGVGTTPVWANGLRYIHTTATSGNLFGLSLATYPEIRPNVVNASSAALDPVHGYKLKNQIVQRRSKIGDILGVLHTAQAYQIVKIGLAISEWQRGKEDEMIDPAPKVGDFIRFCGVRHMIDPHQSKTRVDWINPKFWHRVYLNGVKADFYREPGSGRMVFPTYSSGAVRQTSIEFHLLNSENFGCSDPGSGGFIHTLSVTSGF